MAIKYIQMLMNLFYIPKVRSSRLNSNNRQPDVYKITRVKNA